MANVWILSHFIIQFVFNGPWKNRTVYCFNVMWLTYNIFTRCCLRGRVVIFFNKKKYLRTRRVKIESLKNNFFKIIRRLHNQRDEDDKSHCQYLDINPMRCSHCSVKLVLQGLCLIFFLVLGVNLLLDF